MSDLDKLIEAVEQSVVSLHDSDKLFALPTHKSAPVRLLASRAYDGSLDAALRLHEALLPGWALERLSMWHGQPAHVHIWGTHEERDGKLWHKAKDVRRRCVERSAS